MRVAASYRFYVEKKKWRLAGVLSAGTRLLGVLDDERDEAMICGLGGEQARGSDVWVFGGGDTPSFAVIGHTHRSPTFIQHGQSCPRWSSRHLLITPCPLGLFFALSSQIYHFPAPYLLLYIPSCLKRYSAN